MRPCLSDDSAEPDVSPLPPWRERRVPWPWPTLLLVAAGWYLVRQALIDTMLINLLLPFGALSNLLFDLLSFVLYVVAVTCYVRTRRMGLTRWQTVARWVVGYYLVRGFHWAVFRGVAFYALERVPIKEANVAAFTNARWLVYSVASAVALLLVASLPRGRKPTSPSFSSLPSPLGRGCGALRKTRCSPGHRCNCPWRPSSSPPLPLGSALRAFAVPSSPGSSSRSPALPSTPS